MEQPNKPNPSGPLVLWQGAGAAVVDKPSGLLVHNSAWAGPPERTALDEARAALDRPVVPVHRLDRGTSGCLLVCDRERAAAWQRALDDDGADKRYLALVRGHVRQPVEVDHPIDDGDGVERPARSLVWPLLCSSVERCSLVSVRLFTGRTRQARRHLKHLSHPVLGDASLGKGPLNRDYRARFGLERLALHALRLTTGAGPDGVVADVVAPIPPSLSAPLSLLFPDIDVAAVAARAARATSWRAP